MRDQKNNIGAFETIAPAAKTATENGTGVDIRDFSSATLLVHVGVWTDGTHTFTLEESDDNITFTEVAAIDLIGTLPAVGDATLDGTVVRVGYTGGSRYLRAVNTVAGATTGATLSAMIATGHPHRAPVA